MFTNHNHTINKHYIYVDVLPYILLSEYQIQIISAVLLTFCFGPNSFPNTASSIKLHIFKNLFFYVSPKCNVQKIKCQSNRHFCSATFLFIWFFKEPELLYHYFGLLTKRSVTDFNNRLKLNSFSNYGGSGTI